MTTKLLRDQRERLNEILRRHVRENDAMLSDVEMVWAVFKRFETEHSWALVDPAE